MRAAEAASRAALVLGGLAVALGAAEVVVRRFGPGFQVVFRESVVPSDDPALGYALRPGARDGRHQISAAGLRDRDFAMPKPPGVIRIGAIGDSITYGSGGPREAAYPQRLEALLEGARRGDAPRFEVPNLGVPGYNVEQAAARLRALDAVLDLDAVVYGYTLNDPQAFSIEAEALRRLGEDLAGGAEPNTVERWLARSRLWVLARWALTQRRSVAALRADMPDDPAYRAARSGDPAVYFRSIHSGGEGAARLARGLDALAVTARAADVPVLVVLFPLFGEASGSAPERLADVHRLVAAACTARGLAVLDLLPVYVTAARALGASLHVDFLHPDAAGHRVAAAAIFARLCREPWWPASAVDCGAPLRDPAYAAIARAID
jgi:lysophospholipase L1-like esterase